MDVDDNDDGDNERGFYVKKIPRSNHYKFRYYQILCGAKSASDTIKIETE